MNVYQAHVIEIIKNIYVEQILVPLFKLFKQQLNSNRLLPIGNVYAILYYYNIFSNCKFLFDYE